MSKTPCRRCTVGDPTTGRGEFSTGWRPSVAPMLFVNLPVADVRRSRRFFGRLGFDFDDMFCDDATVCMVINDGAMVILMERHRFAGFAASEVPASTVSREAVVSVAADSRSHVDRLVDAALDSGGAPLRRAEDLGFMYCRSFCDPDGHAWEAVWMDPTQIPRTPDG